MPVYEQRILRYRTSPNDQFGEVVLVFFEDFTSLYLVRRRTAWEVVVASAPAYIQEWAGASGDSRQVTLQGDPLTREFLRFLTSSQHHHVPRSLCSTAKVRDWALGSALPPDYREKYGVANTPSV